MTQNSSKLSRRNVLAAGAVLPLLAAGTALAGDRPTTIAGVGKKAPAFTAPMRGGGTFSNKNFAGKVTIVEFFGLWCPDCMADAPNVAELAGLVRATPGVQFVAVHTRGRYGRWGSLDNFFKEKGYSYPVAIDDDSAVYKAFGIQWVPSYLIIDANGVVRDFTTDLGVSGLGAKGLLARALKFKQRKSK